MYDNVPKPRGVVLRRTLVRTAAAGKAFLVYLGTGSIVTAIIAYIIFKGMGC